MTDVVRGRGYPVKKVTAQCAAKSCQILRERGGSYGTREIVVFAYLVFLKSATRSLPNLKTQINETRHGPSVVSADVRYGYPLRVRFEQIEHSL